MKKGMLLIFALFFCSASIVNAQLKKGNALIGVSTSHSLFSIYSVGNSNLINLGFGSSQYKSDLGSDPKDKGWNFNLTPRAGYFVLNRLACGLDLYFSLSRHKAGTTDLMTVLGIGPFLRYYLELKKIDLFAEGGVSFGPLRYKHIGPSDEVDVEKNSISSFSGGIGIAIPIGETIKFDLMGGYNSAILRYKGNTHNSRTVTSNFGVDLGFLLYFGTNR